MMKITQLNGILSMLFVFFAPLFGMSQFIVNQGDIYISPGSIFTTASAIENHSTGNIINGGELYIKSHILNEGNFNFDGTSGLVSFSGVITQDIEGTSPLYFYNVEFNNEVLGNAFNLTADVSVSNQVTFLDGIIDNLNYGGVFFLDYSATSSSTNNSHVYGYVDKRGNSAFTYPVGNLQYSRPISISPPENVSDVIRAKYIGINSDRLFPHTSKSSDLVLIDSNEYWEMEHLSGNSPVVVSLAWNDNTSSEFIYKSGSFTDLVVTHWDTETNKWINEGGVVDQSTKTVTTISFVKGIGVFALARIDVKRLVRILKCLMPLVAILPRAVIFFVS